MSVPSIAAGGTLAAQLPGKNAPAPEKNAPSPARVSEPAVTVSISDSARRAAAANTQPGPGAASTGDATRAARSAVVHASSSTAPVSQTTTAQYEAKIRAALSRGGDRSVSQIMASLGVPQAEQAQVAAAVGTGAKSAQ